MATQAHADHDDAFNKPGTVRAFCWKECKALAASTARLLPTVRKRARFLAHRQSPRQALECCTLQGRLSWCDRPGGLLAGYTVTRKTGNSVERSRIKRRLKHALAIAAANAQAADGCGEADSVRHICGEIIVIARRKSLALPHATMVRELTKGIDRLLSKSKKAHDEQ